MLVSLILQEAEAEAEAERASDTKTRKIFICRLPAYLRYLEAYDICKTTLLLPYFPGLSS